MVATVCLSNDENLKGEKRRSAFSALTERKRKGCRVRAFSVQRFAGNGLQDAVFMESGQAV